MGNMQKLSLSLLGATALTLLTAGSAHAAGTAAGTNVTNTFTLDYDVGGITQTQITPTSTTDFTVDRFVDLTVASTGDTNVSPGQTGAELVYTLTNNGNGDQSYVLTTFQDNATTGLNPSGGDEFDATLSSTIEYWIDVDGDGLQATDGSEDTQTYSGNTDALPADTTMYITVSGDISLAEENADESHIILVADTTVAGTATPAADDTDGNDLTGEDTVLGDDDANNELIAGDDSNAGDDAASAAYIVAAADLDATKTVALINEDGTGCDNFATTATAGDYSLPGACVEYTISIVNNGSTAAEDVVLVDNLNDELIYKFASHSGFTGTPTFTIDGTAITAPADSICVAGSVECLVSLSTVDLAAGSTGELKIRAIVK